jgi:hypothetical protein
MQDQEFRRNCELRAMDEPVSNQQAFEALDHIVKNPQRDAEDKRTLNQAVSALENFIYIHQDMPKIDESCRPTVEQLQEEQSALVEDLVHKANLLRITEKAIEDIRAICISSMYWKNDEYPSCARILAHHHKIVTDAQVKIAELTAIEYGDDVEVEHS